MNHLEDLHEADTTAFKDKEGNDIESVLAKVIELNSFVLEIVKIRKIREPQNILGCDGGQNKCIVTAIIKEKIKKDESNILDDYKATGKK